MRFAEEAMRGNTKTASFLLNRYAGQEDDNPQEKDLTDVDRQIIESFAQRLRGDGKNKKAS